MDMVSSCHSLHLFLGQHDSAYLISTASPADACAAGAPRCRPALFKFSFKTSFRVTSVHLQCPFKKINKWLKTDFSAWGKNYYLTISLMKTEVKYQPGLDKQHTKPSITLSYTEQSTLTDFTWLCCALLRQALTASQSWDLFHQVCVRRKTWMGSFKPFLLPTWLPFLSGHRWRSLLRELASSWPTLLN
jgi:hypothetical protein